MPLRSLLLFTSSRRIKMKTSMIMFPLEIDHVRRRSVTKIQCQANWNVQVIEMFKNNSPSFIGNYGADEIQRLVMIQSQIFSETYGMIVQMNQKLRRYRSFRWEQSGREISNDVM